jgi:DNA-binding transcriptional MocR family regulator
MLTSLLLGRGDSMLIEEYSYPHVVECQLLPKGYTLLPVRCDEHGMVPEALSELLDGVKAGAAREEGGGGWEHEHPGTAAPPPMWEHEHPGTAAPPPMPRVLYCIPTGGNPTGASLPVQRKQQIYEICR